MAARAASAPSPGLTDAVAAAQRPQARPVPLRPAAALREPVARAAAPYLPASRVPPRGGVARSGRRPLQPHLLGERDCSQHPATAPSDAREEQLRRSCDGLRPSQIPAGGHVHPRIASAIGAARGGGQPLEGSTRKRLEARFGESLGDVRLHADSHAEALARSVSARAFTVGSDLFFAAGAYRPGSRDGDKLIAHEVTHAVQQRDASASGTLSVSAADDAPELEAEAIASASQAEASAHPQSVSTGEHESTNTTGEKRVSRSDAISIARTVDTRSDAYLRGYNDGRAGNPATPGPLSPDAFDDYNQGYQDGAAEAANAQASLPPATAVPEDTGTPPQAPIPAPTATTDVPPSRLYRTTRPVLLLPRRQTARQVERPQQQRRTILVRWPLPPPHQGWFRSCPMGAPSSRPSKSPRARSNRNTGRLSPG